MPAEKKQILKTLSSALVIACLIWGIGWIGVASYHCAPNAEDFTGVNAARSAGLFTFVMDTLVVYYTRYTSTFLYAFNILTFGGVTYFWIMPVTCFLFLAASFYYFITAIVTPKNSKLSFAVYALFFVLIHYATEPSLYYGLFYMDSIFDYMYPWFFTFLWMGCLLRTMQETNDVKRVLLFFAGYLFLILSYGSSELFVAINAFFLFSFFLYVLLYDRSKWKYILPYCIVAGSCTLFLLLSPSPKVSSQNIFDNIASRYPDSNFVIESAKSFVTFYGHYLLHPLSLCFVLIATLIFHRTEMNNRLKINFSNKHLAALFFLSIAGAYMSTWIFFITKGNSGDFPVYIYNCAGIFCQLGLYFVIPIYISRKLAVFLSLTTIRVMEFVAGLLLVGLLLYSSNNIRLIKREYDLGYLQDAKNKTNKFYSAVGRAKQAGTKPSIIYFENPKTIPTSIFYAYDILPNRSSACWNIAYEDYFEVDEVRLSGDTLFK